MKLVKLLVVFCMSVALVMGAASVYADGDVRFWHTDTVKGNLNDNLVAAVQTEFRWNEDDFYYNHEDLSLTYHCQTWDWLYLTGSYRHYFSYSAATSSWSDTAEPNVGATVKWVWQDFKLSNQFRYAYKSPENGDDFSEFRDHLKIVSPWKFTPIEINPYIGNFVYYRDNGTEWGENRFYAGVSFNIYGPVKGCLYYLLQSVDANTDDDWNHDHNIGTSLNVKF